MTECSLCGTELVRTDSIALGACAECRLTAFNEGESLSDRRRRIVAEKLAELEGGGGS